MCPRTFCPITKKAPSGQKVQGALTTTTLRIHQAASSCQAPWQDGEQGAQGGRECVASLESPEKGSRELGTRSPPPLDFQLSRGHRQFCFIFFKWQRGGLNWWLQAQFLHFFFCICLLFYFWLCWVFTAAGLFSNCSERSYSLAAVSRLLIVVASLMEHRLWGVAFQELQLLGPRAQAQ